MAYSHAWYLRNKKTLNEARKRYNERNRSKISAAMMIINEVRSFGVPRAEILERFGHKCACCGVSGRLTIHHIDGNGSNKPVREKNNKFENLMVVCQPCHNKFTGNARVSKNVCAKCGATGMKYMGDKLCNTCYQQSRAAYKKQWYLNKQLKNKSGLGESSNKDEKHLSLGESENRVVN